MKFQVQLLGSFFQPEEIKGDMGQWISGSFFFPLLVFRTHQWKSML